MKKTTQGSYGFTLLELILTITLMGIISVIVGRVLLQNYQIFITSQRVSNTDWQGFIALERMVNDIHTIRSANDIATIGANQLTFTDINGTSVQYQLSGADLLRNSQLLATGITGFGLSYLDANGTVTATPSAVRYISISISATQANLTQTFAVLAGTRGLT